ncbi:MAG: hypothetical protein ACI4DO_01015 [Roseburia sp.]
MNEAVMKREQVKAELVRRFNASKAKSGSIVLTMKLDGVPLIITPAWCRSLYRTIEYADSFSVYVDVPEGRLALLALCASSLDELAHNVMHYSGIDFDAGENSSMRLMNHAADFVAEYDMYDEEQLKMIRDMQQSGIRNYRIPANEHPEKRHLEDNAEGTDNDDIEDFCYI